MSRARGSGTSTATILLIVGGVVALLFFLMAALVVVCIVAIAMLGRNASQKFTSVTSNLQTVGHLNLTDGQQQQLEKECETFVLRWSLRDRESIRRSFASRGRVGELITPVRIDEQLDEIHQFIPLGTPLIVSESTVSDYDEIDKVAEVSVVCRQDGLVNNKKGTFTLDFLLVGSSWKLIGVEWDPAGVGEE